MWFFGGCEYCTPKMLLCGLSGVLFSLILTWFLSTGKVGSKNKRMILWQIIYIYLLGTKIFRHTSTGFWKKYIYLNIHRDFKEINSDT